MLKKISITSVVGLFYFVTAKVVYAHCPLCVAGAAVGITLTRWVGVDDLITGIWIGGLLGSLSFWFSRILGQKNSIYFSRLMVIFVYILVFILTLWSFFKFNLIIRMDKILGYDKLTFGMFLGNVVFYLVDVLNSVIKMKNGKSLFPYQSIVFSLGSMIIMSMFVYILINYYV